MQNAMPADVIIEQARFLSTPLPTTSRFTGVTHPGNWPLSAKFAVEFKLTDRPFPNAQHEWEVRYFDEVWNVIDWLKKKREWIKGTDYDFTMAYKVYTWDLEPVFKYQKTM